MSGSESLPQSNDAPVWKRILSSPVSDLLRGRVGTATSVDSLIAAAGLPQQLGQLISQTVQSTRLWHRERLDVARELISHFHEGLEAGATPDDLARRFGDPQQAAPLIRRARIRCRSRAWHAWRWSLRAAGALSVLFLLSYGLLMVRYLSGRSVVSRDYLAEWNAELKQVPEEDRAWPFYRQAIVLFQNPKDSKRESRWNVQDVDLPDDDPDWPILVEHVKSNQKSIALTREGAARPRFGFRYNDPGDEAYLKHLGRDRPIPESDTPLWEILLPQYQDSRRLARLLGVGCRLALKQGDADSVRQNLRALVQLAQHVTDNQFLIADLVSYAIFSTALSAAGEVLEKQPALLTEKDWIDLAHRLSSYHGGGTIRSSLEGERNMFSDLLQRAFTDDGHGDGRLTHAGFQLIAALSGPSDSPTGSVLDNAFQTQSGSRFALGPVAMTIVAGRREQHDLAMDLINESEREHAGPLFTWPDSTEDARIKQLVAPVPNRLRYAPIALFLPATVNVARAGERLTQRRDGLLTAIAAEVFRREHGDWPESLEKLVPQYLPALPLDRFTGKSLTYKLRDGKPLVYAWGMDGQDDDGRLSGESRPHFWSEIMSKPQKPLKPGEGHDWVLFPSPRQPPEKIE